MTDEEYIERMNWFEARMTEQIEWIQRVRENPPQRIPEPESIAKTAIGLIRSLKTTKKDFTQHV